MAPVPSPLPPAAAAPAPLDADAAYGVLLARDARFDGRLFVGVTSTGVYCRPICRVRTPAKANCRFFATPAEAEAAAFRPCLKCRPEIAPGPGLAWTVMDASRTLARQAADALARAAHAGETPSMASLAATLGVSDRHLRRIFLAEHGVAPLAWLQTRRLLLAKQLLTDTALPVATVAGASGFASVRRFNAAFAAGYRMPPSRLRRAASTARPAGVLLRLAFRPPYDADGLPAFVAPRAVPGVEAVHGGRVVRRSVRGAAVGAPVDGWLEAEVDGAAAQVRLAVDPALAPWSGALIAAVRRWLDLDAAPEVVAAALADIPCASTAASHGGVRLLGAIDPFELAVRAVLGQQVTVAAARTLARRVVERFGTPIATPWEDVTRVFPAPERLARQPIDRIAELGIIRARAGAILALAAAWPELAPRVARGGDPAALVERLCALPGVGPWTAHYIAMRALGWPDAFPPNDIAALKAMRRLYGTETWRAAERRAEAWRPWRGYALLRLWRSLALDDAVVAAWRDAHPEPAST
jgi:AraC family transcriptional regulator of adaptative response / DNA-3-methyladenine glycosylase II